MKRFNMIAAFGVSLLASQLAQADEVDRSLIGYSSELSVRPGDKLEFMVNAVKPGAFHADLVRVINGDSQSRYGSLFKVDEVDAPFAGDYTGESQPLNLGSYIHVEDCKPLDELKSFTVGAWIYPVFDPTTYTAPDLDNPDPFHPPSLTYAPKILNEPQTIASRFDAVTGVGWALRLSTSFTLEFVVGTGSGELKSVEVPLQVRDWDWSYIAASYHAETGIVSVHLMEKPYAPGDQFTARTLASNGEIDQIPHSGPFRIAAARGGAGAARARFEKPDQIFNGRIQDVRILNRSLNQAEIDELSSETIPAKFQQALVADFDFARGLQSDSAEDLSKSGLEGVVVNIPNRAVRG